MLNQRKYILKGNVKNPSWGLQNNNIRIPRVVDGKNVGLRDIQYVPGSSSIWKEENQKEGTPKQIWFTNGDLFIDESDTVKIEYVENHRDYGTKYERFDPEAKAQDQIKAFELVEKAKEMLREYSEDEDKMAATAAILFDVVSMTWGPSQTKMKCFSYADQNPKKVIDALNDPAGEAKYIAALGLRKQVVKTNPQRTAVVWNDDDAGVICNVPQGQKPLSVLGDFLFNEENIVTLQEIGNRLDALEGKKEKAKTTPQGKKK